MEDVIARKPTSTKKTAKKPAAKPAKESQALQFAVEAARLAENTRCHGVVLLDVSSVSPVTDYFIIATGTSGRQMRTIADQLDELGKNYSYRMHRVDGYDSASWILIDFVDVVVHVFSEEARHYYDLENLWGDARRIDFASA